MAGQYAGTTKLKPKNDLDLIKGGHLETAPIHDEYLLRVEEHTVDCDADVDWETVAEYLAQCQTADGVSSVTASRYPQDEPPAPSSRLELRIPASYFPKTIARQDDPSKTLVLARAPVTASTPSPSSNPPQNAGLSTGAKAGIAGGIAIGIVIVVATFITLHTRRRRKKFGYARTKGKDTTAAELDGHFVVTTWPDHGEASPMIKPVHARRASEATIGLSLGRLSSQQDLHHEMEGGGVEHIEERYVVSPAFPESIRTNIYSPTPQPYQPSPLLNRSPSPELEQDPYEQHNQRARPSHPLAQLSEAIPPPKLEKRQVHLMADYQNAVPLGYANGFVQVDHTDVTPDTPTRTWESIQPTYELDLGERFNHGRVGEEADAERGLIQAAEEDRVEDEAEERGNADMDRVEGDSELPQYEEMPGIEYAVEVMKDRNSRENVRWNQSTGHYHIDSDSDDGEGTSSNARRELTKEELG